MTSVRSAPTCSARGPGDAGTTLIEVLMAVILVGFAGVAILGGLATAVRGSDTHHKQAQVGLAVASAAERLKDASVPRVPCAAPTDATYLAAARSIDLPDGWDPAATIRIITVRYSDGTSFTATCHDTDALGHRLAAQLVTIEASSPDGRVHASVAVAKGTDT